MIRALPILYVASAGAAGVSLVAYAGCFALRASRRWRVSAVLVLLGSVIICTLSAVSLYRFPQLFSGKIETVPLDSSRAEVLAILGSPTERIEPANGANQVPIPNSALWHYEIRVWPFQFQKRLEFIDDKLYAK